MTYCSRIAVDVYVCALTDDVLPFFVTDDELGVVKLRHAPLEYFRILHEYKWIAVVVLIVLTHANDYDAVAFIVTTIKKKHCLI